MADRAPHAAVMCDCTALRKASRRISQLYDIALAPSGLKTTQRAILATIRRAGSLSVRELADRLVMDPGGLAHTLKPLMRDGLVASEADPADRRARLLRLTAAGARMLEQSDGGFEAAQAAFRKALGQGELAVLRRLLTLLASDEFDASFGEAVRARSARQQRADGA
jgi:DNA-binding MarR family transcriptional regulator